MKVRKYERGRNWRGFTIGLKSINFPTLPSIGSEENSTGFWRLLSGSLTVG